MDWFEFFSVSVAGIPLILVVMGLVTFYGMVGAVGKVQLILSLVTGIVLGFCYMLSNVGVPTTFEGWFAAIIYGLALGLLASGVYETILKAATKGATE